MRADNVDDAVDSTDGVLNGSGQCGEPLGIVAEDLYLDRLGAAFEIAEHVLQQLDEFDLDQRDRFVHALTQVADDLFRRPAALISRLEAHEDVAAVLCRREETELRSCTARIRSDLWRLSDDALDQAHLAIGVCQGAALRGQVVEDEAAFVRRRKEAGADT